MTATMLGWFFAGVGVIAFVTLWFSMCYRELSAKRKRYNDICDQVQIYRKLYMQERGGENDAAAKNILDNKLMVYREIEKDYKALLRRPINRIPGYIMGFYRL